MFGHTIKVSPGCQVSPQGTRKMPSGGVFGIKTHSPQCGMWGLTSPEGKEYISWRVRDSFSLTILEFFPGPKVCFLTSETEISIYPPIPPWLTDEC